MTERMTGPAACRSCRGRGWKIIRSRRAAVIGTVLRGAVPGKRRECAECGGTGRARSAGGRTDG